MLTAGIEVSLPPDPSTFVPTYTHSFYSDSDFDILGPTPSDVIREIERLVEIGVNHFQVSFDDMTTLRRFIDEVVPAVGLERRP